MASPSAKSAAWCATIRLRSWGRGPRPPLPVRADVRDSPHIAEAPSATVSRFEAAHSRLRADIERGVYAPRERLVEVDVADKLGVSRTTLRAVLVRLAQEGLVNVEANRGARVRSFSLDEALFVLEARGALEGVVAARAARGATDAEIAEMSAILEQMSDAAAAEDLPRYSQLNRRLHAALLPCPRNPALKRLLESLHFPLSRYQIRP